MCEYDFCYTLEFIIFDEFSFNFFVGVLIIMIVYWAIKFVVSLISGG